MTQEKTISPSQVIKVYFARQSFNFDPEKAAHGRKMHRKIQAEATAKKPQLKTEEALEKELEPGLHLRARADMLDLETNTITEIKPKPRKTGLVQLALTCLASTEPTQGTLYCYETEEKWQLPRDLGPLESQALAVCKMASLLLENQKMIDDQDKKHKIQAHLPGLEPESQDPNHLAQENIEVRRKFDPEFETFVEAIFALASRF